MIVYLVFPWEDTGSGNNSDLLTRSLTDGPIEGDCQKLCKVALRNNCDHAQEGCSEVLQLCDPKPGVSPNEKAENTIVQRVDHCLLYP